MSTIEIKNLVKSFGKVKAVNGISFEINEGEILGFLGPNGAGKTTTIRCMMDFLRPDSGEIKILGRDSKTLSKEIKNDLGFLAAEFNMYSDWTGWDHINFIKNIRKIKTYEKDLIEKLSYDPSKKVKTLSSGNKQKLGLILAMMHKPKILILDEPTSGLDPILQQVIYDTLKHDIENGTTIFMSSHNLAEIERVCDKAVIINKGKIEAIENIADLRRRRIYTVNIYFEQEIPKDLLKIEGIKVTRKFNSELELSIKGDIRPLLRKLDEYNIKDIEISHSTLEEIFLEHYK